MRYIILVMALMFFTILPAHADFHAELIQFLPSMEFFNENWKISEIQGFEDLELNFSNSLPDGVIQRFVFTEKETDSKMVTTVSIYDFEDSNAAHDTYQKYVLNLIEKGYKSGPLSEELQDNCFSSTINQGLRNEKTSIVCANSNYIVISTSEQTDYVYHNDQQFTTTIAANGFSYTIFQNIEKFKSNIPEWVKNNARWWADGLIPDQTFINSLQFLIDQKIIVIPEISKMEQNSDTEHIIPEWVKNNARWWADGNIDDTTFIQAIQFLFKEGILR